MASRGIDESTMLEPMDVANDVDEGWSFKSGPGLGTGDEVSTVTWPPIIALPPPPPPLSTSSCEGCRSGDIRFHTGIHWKISSIVIVVVLSGDCPNFPNCVTLNHQTFTQTNGTKSTTDNNVTTKTHNCQFQSIVETRNCIALHTN